MRPDVLCPVIRQPSKPSILLMQPKCFKAFHLATSYSGGGGAPLFLLKFEILMGVRNKRHVISSNTKNNEILISVGSVITGPKLACESFSCMHFNRDMKIRSRELYAY